jgi:hypothetical protein
MNQLSMRKTLLTVALAAVFAAPAFAQQLKLDFQGGLVTVEATNVPVRTILTEWGKVGGTKIVGAERVSGAPLTLKMVRVPESKALETILRSVAGYMAAPRSIAAAGPSMYDRILVMATTSAPAPAATRPTPQQPNSPLNGTQRFAPPRQRAEQPEQPEQDEPEERDENPPNPPVFTFPQPGSQNGFAQPGQVNGAPTNMITSPNGNAPSSITINPATTPGQQTVPGMPTGASTPGMVIQPAPAPGVRPPGGRQ